MTQSTENLTTPTEAVLVLEDGRAFTGRAYGALGARFGEVVFTTAMSGYQEAFTDASYFGQILVLTAPHIGNTGVNSQDSASLKMWLSGVVVRDPARRASNWRSEGELAPVLVEQGVVGISGIDTRALTHHLRDNGALKGGIFSGPALLSPEGYRRPLEDLITEVRNQEPQAQDPVAQTTCDEPYTVEPTGDHAAREPQRTVVVLDLGIDAATIARLTDRGTRVHVVPADTPFEQLESYAPAGVLLPTGPGNPSGYGSRVTVVQNLLDARIPIFGIGLGHQLLGLALGFGTEKLAAGHHSVNHPVKDLRTGKVEITAHNHGFTVTAVPGETHTAPHDGGRYGKVLAPQVCLTDGSIEALECQELPAMSTQYHPAPAAGPGDTAYLFDRFIHLMDSQVASAAELTVLTPTSRNAAKEN